MLKFVILAVACFILYKLVTNDKKKKVDVKQKHEEKLAKEGVLVITAQRHRTRERNREDAQERLLDLLREAATPPPPPRRPTKPSRAAKARRVDEKTRRGTTKRLRGSRPGDE